MPDSRTDPLACWCNDTADYTVQFRTSRFGLLRCRNCGCYQVNPPAIRDESVSAQFYGTYYAGRHSPDAHEDPAGEGEFRSRFWRAVRRAPLLGQINETVLDIGCGDGGLCGELKRAGWPNVLGTDVAETRVERARREHPDISFYCGALEEAAIARSSVDLAIMDNVIEHLPSPRSFLQTVRAYLRPGGRLLVITPNMESGNYRLLGARWTPELAPHVHLFLFTPASLVRLLELAGFAVDTSGSFTSAGPNWRPVMASLIGGAVKESVWRFGQAVGDAYGKMIGRGAMVFASGRRV